MRNDLFLLLNLKQMHGRSRRKTVTSLQLQKIHLPVRKDVCSSVIAKQNLNAHTTVPFREKTKVIQLCTYFTPLCYNKYTKFCISLYTSCLENVLFILFISFWKLEVPLFWILVPYGRRGSHMKLESSNTLKVGKAEI